jgi:hypothetical protein
MCDVTSWPIEAVDKAQLDRIAANAEYNWNGCCCGFGRMRREST